jgi:undecaprenyl diphosphate synthase
MAATEARNLPRHVGIIMDGNGRWAAEHGLPRVEGHRAGSRAVTRTVRAARRVGLEALTLFAFSSQNWRRPDDEVQAIMGLLTAFLLTEREELLATHMRLEAVGDLSRLPAEVRQVLEAVRRETTHHTGMTLTLAVSYGGQEEIADTARRLAVRATRGEIDPDCIDVATFAAHLPSMQAAPPDLIVRTGGDMRLSNFLLFGAAYAELYFTERLWPDFDEADLLAAIASYQSRERRFGGLDGSGDSGGAR